MDVILRGGDYKSLLKRLRSQSGYSIHGMNKLNNHWMVLLESVAKALYYGELDRDAARTAFEALQECKADVPQCIENALLNKRPLVYKPLLENLKFDEDEEEEAMVELLRTIVVCCDPGGDDNDEIDRALQCLIDNDLNVEKPLSAAMRSVNMVAVNALLRLGVGLNDPCDDYVAFACCDEGGDTAKLLIGHGYDVNIDSESNGTALHAAAINAVSVNKTKCLELFMKAGAKERSVPCAFAPGVGAGVFGLFSASKEELTPSQCIKKFAEDRIASGDPPSDGALERALHVLGTVRSGDKET
ncbi:unnamed protein product, partial [Ectocarpus sp. 6 AP-2014]